MAIYNVFEDTDFVETVTAANAKNAIRKVENERKGYLMNAQAVNTQDANDCHPLREEWKPIDEYR